MIMEKIDFKNVFAYCSRCDRAIEYGDQHITIERNIFKHVSTPRRKQTHTWVDGDILFMLCSSCSKKFDSDTIWHLLYLVPADN